MSNYWDGFYNGYWDAALAWSSSYSRSLTGLYAAGYRAGQVWRIDGIRPYGIRFWYPAWPGGVGTGLVG